MPEHPAALPARRTKLFGREADRRAVRDLVLHGDGRLVTLTGIGGVGKTTLAYDIARELAPTMPDGAWLIDLSAVPTGSDLDQSLCAALGLFDQARAPAAVLVDFLAPRQCLLCLDNCEWHADALGTRLDRLLDRCPDLRILATSRRTLHVRGEAVFLVRPLAVPAGDSVGLDEVARSPAVELFVERARSVRAGFTLTEASAGAVAAICRTLDGIPLALELAAAQAVFLDPAEIEPRLAGSPILAVSDSGDATGRQRTMEATLDWSCRLLGESEQALFRRLAVFAGGWTVAAAEQVCALGGDPAVIAASLRALADHSLVVRESGEAGSRFRFLVPVAAYASERLAASPEGAQVMAAHATWALALAARRSPGHTLATAEDLDRISAEHENCVVGLRRALAARQVPLVLGFIAALREYWRVRGLLRFGRRQLQDALDLVGDDPTPHRTRLLLALANYSQQLGDLAVAQGFADRALAASQATSDVAGLRTSYGVIGDIESDRGKYPAAREAYRQARVVLDAGPDVQALGFWYANVGGIALREGSLVEAEEMLAEARLHLVAVGPTWYLGHVLAQLGAVARRQGDLAEAEGVLTEALGELRRYGAVVEAIGCLEEVARLGLARGDATRGAMLLGAATALRENIGVALSQAARSDLDRATNEARVKLAPAAFLKAWSRGRSLSFEQATGVAMSQAMPGPDRPAGAESDLVMDLTPREREVAALVAAGLSNAKVAEQLAIAPGTARIHVERIRGKLGLTSRVQVATWVLRGGLDAPAAGARRP